MRPASSGASRTAVHATWAGSARSAHAIQPLVSTKTAFIVDTNSVVVNGAPPVVRRSYRLGTIERVVGERARRAAAVVDWDNLKCWPAAIDHCKTRARAHTLDNVGERGA